MSLISDLALRALAVPAIARSPIWLFRNGFGGLMGQRMLLLEHTGRRCGQARYVCLEVVDRPAPDRIVVISGFGSGAQWFRNLLVTPRCRVTIGRRRLVPAVAAVLPQEQVAQILTDYQRRHPYAWRQLEQVIEQATGAPVLGVPGVELRLSPTMAGS